MARSSKPPTSAAWRSAATTASSSASKPGSRPGSWVPTGGIRSPWSRTILADLDQAAHAVTDPGVSMPGPARTGGDTALPMRDLIRMAADALHYLTVFDDHTDRPIYLGRQARIATADQRMICYARDGGCTRPDCTAGGRTDADALFFACGPDHTLLTDGHYSTTVTDTGRLAWPGLDRRHHHESTTPTTPTNSSKATPTHRKIKRLPGELRHHNDHGVG